MVECILECTLKYISLAFLIFGIIISLVFYFKCYKFNYEDNFLISEIDNSLNGNLIQSISFKETCDIEEEKLILGIWDETSEGCDCNGNILNWKCSKKQKENDCVSLFSDPPVECVIFNSSYLCVKRLKLKYRELLKTNQVISKEKNCPLNYTFCGVLDTLGRKLCVKNEESCPLNINIFKIKFLNY